MSAWTDFVRQHIKSCPGSTPQERMRNCAKMYRGRKGKGFGKGMGNFADRTAAPCVEGPLGGKRGGKLSLRHLEKGWAMWKDGAKTIGKKLTGGRAHRGVRGRGFGRGVSLNKAKALYGTAKGRLSKAAKALMGGGVRSIMPAREGASGGGVSAGRRIAANIHGLVRSH